MEFPIYLKFNDSHCGVIISQSEARWFFTSNRTWQKETLSFVVAYYIRQAGKTYTIISKEEFKSIINSCSKPKDTTGW